MSEHRCDCLLRYGHPTTQDADTLNGSDTDSQSFASVFQAAADNDGVYGADGAGSIVISGYALSLEDGVSDSGLTSGGNNVYFVTSMV